MSYLATFMYFKTLIKLYYYLEAMECPQGYMTAYDASQRNGKQIIIVKCIFQDTDIYVKPLEKDGKSVSTTKKNCRLFNESRSMALKIIILPLKPKNKGRLT